MLFNVRDAGDVLHSLQQCRTHLLHLRFKARRQNCQPQHLDQPDVLLLDVVYIGMRMEQPERMLRRRAIVPEDEIELEIRAAPPRNRRDRVVRRIRLRQDLHRRVAVCAPCGENPRCQVNERSLVR